MARGCFLSEEALEEACDPRRIRGAGGVLQETIPYSPGRQVRQEQPLVEALVRVDLAPIRDLLIQILIDRRLGIFAYLPAQFLIFSAQLLDVGSRGMSRRPNCNIEKLMSEILLVLCGQIMLRRRRRARPRLLDKLLKAQVLCRELLELLLLLAQLPLKRLVATYRGLSDVLWTTRIWSGRR